MTSTAIWNVGRVSKSQRQKTTELVTEVQEARRQIEEAAQVISIKSVRLRNMAGELIRENTEALAEAHKHDDPHTHGR